MDEEKSNACCLIAPCKKNGSEVTKGTYLQRHAGFTLQKNVQVLCLSGGYLGGLFRLHHPWRVLVVHSQWICFLTVSMDRAVLHTLLGGDRVSFLGTLYVSEIQVYIYHLSAWEFWGSILHFTDNKHFEKLSWYLETKRHWQLIQWMRSWMQVTDDWCHWGQNCTLCSCVKSACWLEQDP